ncbi:MAG: nicotinate-nucleotide adenylyltransferase, partial [Desulfobulbaceae bacterium]|nr:nicotinate-nucleotide adenylyltransferase [Desulfobulbaceae bacterium]
GSCRYMNMAEIKTDDGDVIKQWGRRIGLLGGTFDPIHNGHLSLADYVLDVLELDSILFIPAARPPHKGHVKLTSFQHRSAMVNIAVLDKPRFFVSNIELQRTGPSYSIDTLKELRGFLDPGVQLFFIIGMDTFVELDTWEKGQQLLDYADLVVVARPEYPLGLIGTLIDRFGHYSFDAGRSCWAASDRLGRIYPVNMPPIAISSTDVREKAGSGGSMDGLISPAVAEYIEAHDLFGGDDS